MAEYIATEQLSVTVFRGKERKGRGGVGEGDKERKGMGKAMTEP